MKITVVLKKEHETLITLFDKFRKVLSARTQNGKKELFEEIRRELLLHSQMEAEIFDPALRATTSIRAAQLADRAGQEHHAIEKMLQELSNITVSDRNFDAKMEELIDLALQHIEKEEEEIFDEARKNLPEYRLEELGLELEDRRKILLTLAA